nr:unnamed protein product [Digitaria exilis]
MAPCRSVVVPPPNRCAAHRPCAPLSMVASGAAGLPVPTRADPLQGMLRGTSVRQQTAQKMRCLRAYSGVSRRMVHACARCGQCGRAVAIGSVAFTALLAASISSSHSSSSGTSPQGPRAGAS